MKSVCNIWALSALLSFSADIHSAVASSGNTAEYESVSARMHELCERGEYIEAIPCAETALVACTELFGQISTNTVQLSQLLASLYYYDNQMVAAETLLTNSLHVWQLLGLSNSASYAECLNNLGEVYRIRGKYSQAALAHKRALALRKHLYPQDNYYVVESCNNVAEVLRIIGQYDTAEALFLAGIQNGKNNITNQTIVAILQNNLAFLYRELGKYTLAEQLYSRVLTNISTLARDECAAVYNDLAILSHDRSDFYGAKTLYETSFGLYTNTFGVSSRHVSRVLKNLAGLYKSQALYADAEQCYAQALDICYGLFSSNHIRVASLLNDLAVLYRVEGKYQEAEALYESVLNIRSSVLGPNHPAVGHTYNNIAQLYRYQEKYSAAETNFNLAIALLCASVNSNSPDIADCYNNLGELYAARSQHLDARRYYDSAFQIFTNYFGTNNLHVAAIYSNIGDVYFHQTNFFSAEKEYLRSLALREYFLGNTHPLTAETLHKLALVYTRMGSYTNAMNVFERALNNYESAAIYSGEEDLATELRCSQRELCSDYIDLLNILFSQKILDEQTVCDKFITATELSRARSVLDQLLNSSIRFSGGIPEKELQQVEDTRYQLKALHKNIARILSLPRSPDRDATVQSLALKRTELYGRRTSLLSRLEKDYPRFAAIRQPTSVSTEVITGTVLNSNEVAVSYWVNKSNVYVCILSRFEKKFLSLPVDRSILSKKVALYKTVLESYEPLFKAAEFKSISFSLFKDILGPVITNISVSRYDILYIVPHDILNTIPFEPLISDKNGKQFSELSYVFQSIPFAYIPSLRSLQSIRNDIASGRYAQTAQTDAFLFGDPLYTEKQANNASKTRGLHTNMPLNSGVRETATAIRHYSSDSSVTRVFRMSDQALTSIVPLEGSRKEIQSLSRLLNKNNVAASSYLGLNARESILKALSTSNLLQNVRFLHFATHGVLPGDISGITEPCLVMSIYGDEFNDGFLKMSEIFGLSLNADLVTLSACQTGAIDTDSLNENLSGFAQAFFYAGTPRLTVTLWNIADKSTYRLMNHYYSAMLNVNHSVHTAEALAEAKRNMLKEKKFSHPFYWAGFITLGEWH